MGHREEGLPRPPVPSTAPAASDVLIFGWKVPQCGRPPSWGSGAPWTGTKGSKLVEPLVIGPGPSPDLHVKLRAVHQTCSGRDGLAGRSFLPLQGLRHWQASGGPASGGSLVWSLGAL